MSALGHPLLLLLCHSHTPSPMPSRGCPTVFETARRDTTAGQATTQARTCRDSVAAQAEKRQVMLLPISRRADRPSRRGVTALSKCKSRELLHTRPSRRGALTSRRANNHETRLNDTIYKPRGALVLRPTPLHHDPTRALICTIHTIASRSAHSPRCPLAAHAPPAATSCT